MEPLVKSTHLIVRSPERRTLIRGLKLSIQSGEKLLLVGRNGVGKSTLLRGLAGLTSDVEGDTRTYLPSDALYVPANPLEFLLPWLTVSANIEFFAHLLQGEKAAFRGFVARYMDTLKVNIDGRYGAPVYRLSLGQRSALALAIVQLMKQKIILIDEVLANLAEASRISAARQIMEKSCAVVICSHSREIVNMFEGNVVDLDTFAIEG